MCLDCGWETYWRCDVTDAAKCGDCSERKRKLIARLVDLGTTERLAGGFTYFLTLNAPGENDHRRWRQGKGGNDRPACDCHHTWEHQSRGVWNAQESACWNRLRLSLVRLLGSVSYIGSVEVQKRGALHRHVVLHSAVALTPAELQPLQLAAGYGCVSDLQIIRSAQKAAHYVAKYVTKSAGLRGEVPWVAEVVDYETGEVRTMKTTPTFRTWSSSQSWGYTVKGLKEIARVQARARARYLADLAQLLAEDDGAAPLTGTAIDSTDPPPP